MKLQVTAVRAAAWDIRSIELRDRQDGELPAFTPGAHLRVQIALADGSVARREYSLVNDPSERTRYEVAVLRARGGRGGSAAMHALRVGDVLDVSAPVNAFPLVADAREHLLIAGGIGITPVLCMARALAAAGASMSLHYSARTRDNMAYRDEAAALPGSQLYCDEGDPTRGLPLRDLLSKPRAGRHLYVCGPKTLIAAVLEQAAAFDWPAAQVHQESFDGAVALSSDRPIRLHLKSSGRSIDVAADETILEALLREGLDPLFDCRRGECGMCVTDVLGGTPDHRDHVLTQREHEGGRVICTCVSRALSPELVLDL